MKVGLRISRMMIRKRLAYREPLAGNFGLRQSQIGLGKLRFCPGSDLRVSNVLSECLGAKNHAGKDRSCGGQGPCRSNSSLTFWLFVERSFHAGRKASAALGVGALVKTCVNAGAEPFHVNYACLTVRAHVNMLTHL